VLKPTGILFQSTPARGGRPHVPNSGAAQVVFQSTPARGGRRDGIVAWLADPLFQSTPARGGRRQGRAASAIVREFQSTPARGGRPPAPESVRRHCRFNPRPRAAGDSGAVRVYPDGRVSIHARARRATP